jgi:phage terminase large subunit-like protein
MTTTVTQQALSDALSVLEALVLEDGRRWGEAATDFQHEDAERVLDTTCTTPYHYLTRSRGSSKTSDLVGLILAILLTQLRPGDKCYGVGSDQGQARLLHDAAVGFIQRTPGLTTEFTVGSNKLTSKRTGATFEALAADAPGAWGLRGKLFVLDEVAQYPTTPTTTQFVEAITSAAAKVSDARMVVLTTAGSPSHPSHKLLEHAKGDPLWRIHEVKGPSPWASPDRLAEQQRRLPESSYRRLFLNQWVEPEDSLTTIADLRAAIQLAGPLEPVRGQRYIIGLDVGLKNDRSVATICHVEETGESVGRPTLSEGRRVVLDRIAVWQGTRKEPVQLKEVEAWLAHASKEFNSASIIFDPWQAAGSMQRLRGQGVRVIEYSFTAASVGRLAVGLHNALRNRALALPDDPDLIEELANVRIKETSPNVYRLDHPAGQHDDRAISLALCVEALLSKPQMDIKGLTIPVLWQTSPARPEQAGVRDLSTGSAI